MLRSNALPELPASYRVETSGRGHLAVRRELEPALRATGFGLESDGQALASDLVGRRPLRELRAAGEVFVLRVFSHGGLARWLTGARFKDPGRPFRELVLSERLRAAGVLTPTVVAARARRAPLAGWQLALVTRRIEAAEDLGRRLIRVRSGEHDRLVLRPWIERTARAVRALHDLGLEHADLNPHNLLLRERSEGAGAEVWILDLDRSVLSGSLPERARRANLGRLFRHVRRRDAAGLAAVTRADAVRFLRAYAKDGESWKERFLSIAGSHARGSLAHSAGWALERAFGRPPRS